jgi:hypothetical protein
MHDEWGPPGQGAHAGVLDLLIGRLLGRGARDSTTTVAGHPPKLASGHPARGSGAFLPKWKRGEKDKKGQNHGRYVERG